MARVELDLLERLEVGAARLHELDGAVDLAGEALVARFAGFAEKPWFHECTWRRSANPPWVNARIRFSVEAAMW